MHTAGVRARRLSLAVVTFGLVAVSGGIAHAQPPDPGPYPTMPSPPLGLAGSTQAGARVEGQRMADFVVGPWEVDPTLLGKYDDGVVAVDGAEALAKALPADLAEALARHGVVDGFATTRWADDISLEHVVIRFADPLTAQAAAKDLADTLAGRKVADGPVTATQIPGHPQTAAYSHPFVEEDGRSVTYVRSVTAHGPYVFSDRAMSADGTESATRLIAGVLDQQPARIDRFVATPPILLGTLPVDPSGLVARVLPPEPTATASGAYRTHGALHLQNDPVVSARIFADNGVSAVVYGLTTITESDGPDASRRLAEHFAEEIAPFVTADAAPVDGVPGSRCLELYFPRTGSRPGYCIAAVDRYTVEAEGDDVIDASHRLAAQYVMLTG